MKQGNKGKQKTDGGKRETHIVVANKQGKDADDGGNVVLVSLK